MEGLLFWNREASQWLKKKMSYSEFSIVKMNVVHFMSMAQESKVSTKVDFNSYILLIPWVYVMMLTLVTTVS